jgi:hypothetical protein
MHSSAFSRNSVADTIGSAIAYLLTRESRQHDDGVFKTQVETASAANYPVDNWGGGTRLLQLAPLILGVVRRRSVHKAGYEHNGACAAASPVMAGGIEEALRIIAMLGVP